MAVPTNLPKGTYVSDGLRSGPYYTRQVNTTVSSTGTLVSANRDKWGPAVLYSPLALWSCTPNASTAGNIVTATAVAAAGYLALTQDQAATTLVNSSNSLNTSGPSAGQIVQFDYPRVVNVTLAGGNLGAATNVTIFGSDFYGLPLQTTYSVQNQGSYPANQLTAPAFYQIWGVYCNGVVGGGVTIALRTTNTIGLPYFLNSKGSVVSFSYGPFQSMLVQAGQQTLVAGTAVVTTPATGASPYPQLTVDTVGGTQGYLTAPTAGVIPNTSFTITSTSATDTSIVNWSIPNGGYNLIAVGDTNVPAANTGDVRGLIRLPDFGETTWKIPCNGQLSLQVSYFQAGANTWQNLFASANIPIANNVPAGTTVPFLTMDQMYGLTPYYTGVYV